MGQRVPRVKEPEAPAVRWSVPSNLRLKRTEQWTSERVQPERHAAHKPTGRVDFDTTPRAGMVETRRLELPTLSLQRRCSPS